MDTPLDPRSIVVGTDGSIPADRAVEWAAHQAQVQRRPLAVATIANDGHLVRDRAVALVRAAHPDLEVSGLVGHGDPRHALLELSRQAHLLVLGSRGRGPMRSILLGSVSATVAANADCPTVVSRGPSSTPGTGVLVGADGSPESLPVVRFAFGFAADNGLPVTVLHTFWDAVAAVAQFREAQGRPADAPELEELRALLSESISGLGEEYPDVPVRLELRHGLADEALARRESAWDLVVVGRHPMSRLDRVVNGSVASSVVERSRCSVAVVPVVAGHDEAAASR